MQKVAAAMIGKLPLTKRCRALGFLVVVSRSARVSQFALDCTYANAHQLGAGYTGKRYELAVPHGIPTKMPVRLLQIPRPPALPAILSAPFLLTVSNPNFSPFLPVTR